jgi:hypothetical protein
MWPWQARLQTWSRLVSQSCTPTTPCSRNDYLVQLDCAGGEQVPRRSHSQILLVLWHIKAPASFVVVAGGWPGSLISLLTLALPVQEAFLPARYHKYFKPSRYCVSPWHHSIEFVGPKACHGGAIYIVLGKPDFLRHVLATLSGCKRLIVTVNVECCGVSRPLLSWAAADGL